MLSGKTAITGVARAGRPPLGAAQALPGPRRLHRRAAVPGRHQRPRRTAVLRRRPHRWQTYCTAARVEIDIHQLRHAHATELINAGVSIEAVRRRLGHASTETSQLYALLDERRNEKSRQLSRVERLTVTFRSDAPKATQPLSR
ncbi:tyrosine-type recombinase/integrase [Nonomuraea angiospora]|uniref:tyrosine-type recombinase/integrase n=1 Tax=Nonomuraea angiospora TaxID=46172 RepID=UPI00331B9781